MRLNDTILLVDDDFDDRFLVVEAFKSTAPDLKISEASDGSQAIKLMLSMPTLPSLILVDMNMPGMDGIETIQHIRLINPSLPIILLTTSLTASLADQAMRLGANACFNKPISFSDLCSLTVQLHRCFLQP